MRNNIKNVRMMKPVTSGTRGMSFALRKNLSKGKPVRSLTIKAKRSLGRDNTGKISVRHKGGGAKRKYRIITTLDKCIGKIFEVVRLEYDPNRSAHIALIRNEDGRHYYILAPRDIKTGHTVSFTEKNVIENGNRMLIGSIPTGIEIHAIEITPNSKAKMVRAAGTKAVIMSREGDYTLIKLPSGEVRKFHNRCMASVGSLSNEMQNMIKIGKAGRKRHMGVRPSVRGKAMHPAAHPHGGGEGVNPIGLKYPKTPWGKHAMGYKTSRKPNPFIVKPRSKRRKK